MSEEHFKFLIDSPEKSMKFIKHFHADMASTQELLQSAVMSSLFTLDFTSIATKAVESSYIFIKPEKMKYSRI